jgi:hypothetical protein
MLLADSGGLHHVHAPGDRFPRPSRTIAARLEVVDLAEHRAALGDDDMNAFRRRVVGDLTERRNHVAPVTGPTIPHWAR